MCSWRGREAENDSSEGRGYKRAGSKKGRWALGQKKASDCGRSGRKRQSFLNRFTLGLGGFSIQ
jgi:hypothetical protein